MHGERIYMEDFAQFFGVYPENNYDKASYNNLAKVLWIETGAAGITEFIGRWNGQCISIKGRIVILAANALATPALLLRSTNDDFPQGIGNASGMVGRNLMAHVSDAPHLQTEAPPEAGTAVFATVVEDFPYPQNRVTANTRNG